MGFVLFPVSIIVTDSVFYADIKGFSSFASEREPRHVFKLLQTVFLHFDKIARKRKVFKVDTLGGKGKRTAFGF